MWSLGDKVSCRKEMGTASPDSSIPFSCQDRRLSFE